MVGIWSAGRPANLAEPSSVAVVVVVFDGMVMVSTLRDEEFVM